MRRFGDVLMWLGAGVGAAVGVALMIGVVIPGVPWLVAVGLVKLTLLGALGLIGAGAVVRRLARRSDERVRLTGGSGHPGTGACAAFDPARRDA
jgi:hypothetical protein